MKKILVLFLSVVFCSVQLVEAQSKIVTNFYGTEIKTNVCKDNDSSLQDADVERLITDLLIRSGAENRFIIQSCNEINNCQAIVRKDGKAYLFYNPNFLTKAIALNFTMGTAPIDIIKQDWRVLGVLSHELGHLINNHLTNTSKPNQLDLELEADEYAGYMMYLMGATLKQTQSCMLKLSETGSSTSPARKERVRALEKGFNKAKKITVSSEEFVYEELKEDEIYTTVEVMPEFPGGAQNMYFFIAENTKYPPDAKKAKIEGTVYIGFVVLEDGKLDDIVVSKGLPNGGLGCDEEALKTIKKMPQWTPGKHEGKNVKVAFTIPFKFKLD